MLRMTYKICLLSIPCIMFLTSCGRTDSHTRNMLAELGKTVARRAYYADSIQAEIDSLMSCMNDDISPANAKEEYRLSKQLFEVSHLYSFEYAQKSASRMVTLAQYLGNADAIVESRTLQAYNYARAGFYHEAQDSLDNIALDDVSPATLAMYYITRGRVCHDMADYTHDDKYTPYYNRMGNRFLQKSLDYLTDPMVINYVKGKILLKKGILVKAKAHYLKALQLCNGDNAEAKGVLTSSLAYICKKTDDPKAATHYYIDACGICIRNAFRDVNSLRGLAEMLYHVYDDIDGSSVFINLAIENAQAYGTRSRINNMGAMMPLFIGQKLQNETTAKHVLMALVCFIALLMVVLLILLKRYHARNRQLDFINGQLEDTNKMKETYLGMFINSQSEFSFELNNFAMVAQQKLKMQQYDALGKLISQLEKKYSGAKVLSTFDNVFLTIYPTFIEELNALLLPEHKMVPKSEGELPPMMRIFALIRLGITDNNRIAAALNYSYNTVHNYRVRVRNMSHNPQTFEEKVAKIGNKAK